MRIIVSDHKPTIAFCGDSFCEYVDDWNPQGRTWLRSIVDHYGYNVVHSGFGGSSIWDLAVIQLPKLLKVKSLIDVNQDTVCPDTLIITITSSYRVFDRTHRNIGKWVIDSQNSKTDPVLSAAREYYLWLWDQDKSYLEDKMLMHYLDTVVFDQLKNRCKIICMWSFGTIKWDNFEQQHPLVTQYAHIWENAAEIRPSLHSVSVIDNKWGFWDNLDPRPNHLEDHKNPIVFEMVKDAIDHYEPGKIFDNSNKIAKLWEGWKR